MLLRMTIFLLMLVPAAMAWAQVDVREPTAKWVVNFDDAQCVASRAYGSEEEPLYLVLKAPPLGDVMQIAVLKEGRPTDAEQVEASIRVDERSPLKTNMLVFSPKNEKLRMYLLNMTSADFALVRQAKSLAICSTGLNEGFALSQMEPLLKIMDRCVADLRQVWNVSDPKNGEQSVLEERARGDIHRLFKGDDYPGAAMLEGQSGRVKFAALIDESGRVADCTIIETSGVASLDAQTCAIMRERAKLQPARGKGGKPAKDAIIQTVRWTIPD